MKHLYLVVAVLCSRKNNGAVTVHARNILASSKREAFGFMMEKVEPFLNEHLLDNMTAEMVSREFIKEAYKELFS